MRLAGLIAVSAFVYALMQGSRVAVTLSTMHLTGSTAITGMLMGVNALMPILIGIAVGRLIDRFGILRPMYATTALSLTGTLLPFVWPGVWTLALASASQGAAFVTAAVALSNAGAMIGRVEDRTRNIGLIYLGNSAGMAVGPLIAGLGIDHVGHRGTFALLAVLPAASMAVLFAMRHVMPGRTGSGKAPAGHLLDVLREGNLRNMLILQVLVSICLESFYFMVPLHGTQIGLSASMIGTVLSCAFVSNFASRTFLPPLVRRFGEVLMVAAVLVILALSVAPIGHATAAWQLMIMAWGTGICHGMVVPIMTSITFSASPRGREGEVSGMRSMTIATGAGITQLAGGVLIGVTGIAPVMWAMGGIALFGSWFARHKVRLHDHNA
jgi:MFS family permease